MDISLELDTSYHERQKKKINHQEKKPEASKSNSSHPQNSSSSNQNKKKNFQKRDKLHFSFLNKDFKLMGSEKKESRRAYVPIVVGSIVLSLVSKGLETSLPSHQENFPARETPE
ncbi:hypothetical protein O181_014903 [Austropuccinia psidii MF-1]|uniref:Uncharacterized protein n=1 Tax=Austropuccinia psidii MF-1 TaxID=1389203 RepID=A0A9Q3C1G1_9BASI|nr:hypothetical protein [Austropuccinia psidii MF-1]